VILVVGGSTTGRTASVCGEIGVAMMPSMVGTRIGPPADKLYAVEPVAVATMIPSALYCPICSSSAQSRSVINRAVPLLWMTASFTE